MTRSIASGALLCSVIVLLVAWSAAASDAQLFFSSDKTGTERVTQIDEGDEVFIVVLDPDENIDCDVRDKIWTDVKVMDPKTGAYIVWVSYRDESGDANGILYADDGYTPYKGHSPGSAAGWLGADYLEETEADTGLFVSRRAFQVGAREDVDVPRKNTHVVCSQRHPLDLGASAADHDLMDFQWGHYEYLPVKPDWPLREWLTEDLAFTPGLMDFENVDEAGFPDDMLRGLSTDEDYTIGRFENMDTLVGMYQDPDDASDVAIALMKISDAEATISWDRAIYADGNEAATITVVDPDENLYCDRVEYVPVFVLVNPGSWNALGAAGTAAATNGIAHNGPNNFCMLMRTGGIAASTGSISPEYPIRWYNIYHSQHNVYGKGDGRYYVRYDEALFDTAGKDGITAVSFFAQETASDTGVFQLNLNSLLVDLGFDGLKPRDVLVAYYIDPNDFDDFKLATATIEERQHSITSFVDDAGAAAGELWLGRDAVYVQVVDANANVDPCCPEQVVVHLCDPHAEDDVEWLILDEQSSNSPAFRTPWGVPLLPVWNALGIGLLSAEGGYQLQLDNWKVEAFNEDDLYVRYNDVYYAADGKAAAVISAAAALLIGGTGGLHGLGDANTLTSFPPRIDSARVLNDVSFALVSIADTQVYDGTTTQMWFLDRQGGRVSGYGNGDCVFIEVYDPDQDEDQRRRERIDGYWDGGHNWPFGPQALNEFDCGCERARTHEVNDLLGDANIRGDEPDTPAFDEEEDGAAKIYVLNPRSGRWAAVDLLETGVGTGHFVSVICIDLVDVRDCVPTLDVLPGDTIVAAYQDPSNHSDSAWISIKVGIGGAGTPPGQSSTTTFVDADGNEVATYTDADRVYVQVIDPSHAGEPLLANAVEIDGQAYDLTLRYGAQTDAAEGTFLTAGLDLDLVAGESLTATYTDPTDPMDASSDTVPIVASALDVEGFHAGPSPFDVDCTFGYTGTGVASVMSVEVYALSGTLVWASERSNVTEIVWDGTTGTPCSPVANGGYVYVITATDGTSTFAGKGVVFVSR